MRIPFDPRHSKRRTNPDGTMSLVDHLYELRTRLLLSVLAIVVTTAVGFFWYSHQILGIESLGELSVTVLLAACVESRRPEQRRVVPSPRDRTVRAVHAPFQGRADRGHRPGLPIWLYQLWAFTPRPLLEGAPLRDRLRMSGAALFMAGAVLAYVVVAKALHFLLTIGDNVQITALGGAEYFGFIINLLIIFGVSFEIPLLIVALNFVGILHLREAEGVAPRSDLRSVRIRRDRHPRAGPVLDARARVRVDRAVRGRRADRPPSTTAKARARNRSGVPSTTTRRRPSPRRRT